MNKLTKILILFSLVTLSWFPLATTASYEYHTDSMPAPVTIVADPAISSHDMSGQIINLPNKHARIFDDDEYHAEDDYVCRYREERRYGCKRQKICGWRKGEWVCWWSHKDYCGWFPVWIKRCYWD